MNLKVQFKKKGNDSLLTLHVVSKTSKLAIKSDRFTALLIFWCDCCQAFMHIPKVTTEDMCYLKMHSLYWLLFAQCV